MWSRTVTEYSSSRKLRNTYSLNDSKEYETISNSDSMKSEAATSENKAYYTAASLFYLLIILLKKTKHIIVQLFSFIY